jgi:hypothetical protein
VNKGVIGFSRKVEWKSLLLDKILKKDSRGISKVMVETLSRKNQFSGISIRFTDSTL